MVEVEERVGDAEENRSPVKLCDLFMSIYSIVAYFGDIVLDIHVATRMAIGYRISSIGIILVQSLASNIASWKWYKNSGQILTPWEVSMHVILLAPVLRCGKAIYYAWKIHSTNGDYHLCYKKLYIENLANIAFIAVLEGFLEAGPQLVIQFGEWIRNSPANELNKPEWLRMVSVLFSFVCLGATMLNYHASLRRSQDDTGHISIPGKILMFFWHFMIEISRVIVLVCLVVISPISLVACIFHILGFFIYLQRYGPLRNFDNSEMWHQLLVLSFSCVYIFTAIPVRDGPTHKFYVLIYSVFAVEGIVVFIVWCSIVHWPFNIIWPITSLLSFLLGLGFMGLYYKYFHPKHPHCNSKEELEGKDTTSKFPPTDSCSDSIELNDLTKLQSKIDS